MALKDLSLSERIRAYGRQCAHPYVYYSNGERKVASCGKCPACLAQKANAHTKVLQQEYNGHQFKVFVTLTYNNDNVPLLYAEKRDCHFELFDVTSNEINNSIQRYNLDFHPKMYQTQLAKEIAQVALFETQNNVSKQSIKESISRTAETWTETTGVRLSNRWIDKISESTAGKIKAEQKRILGQYHLDKRDLDNMFGYYLNTNVVPAIRGSSDTGRTLAPLLIK